MWGSVGGTSLSTDLVQQRHSLSTKLECSRKPQAREGPGDDETHFCPKPTLPKGNFYWPRWWGSAGGTSLSTDPVHPRLSLSTKLECLRKTQAREGPGDDETHFCPKPTLPKGNFYWPRRWGSAGGTSLSTDPRAPKT